MTEEKAQLLWWQNSPDPRAVAVRADIIKGLFKCNNFGSKTDVEYLTSPEAIKHSVTRLGYKLEDIV